MPIAKKNNAAKISKKKYPSKADVKALSAEEEVFFPEKLARANEILSKTTFLDRSRFEEKRK